MVRRSDKLNIQRGSQSGLYQGVVGQLLLKQLRLLYCWMDRCESVMHHTGIAINSGMIPLFSGIGIGIKVIKTHWKLLGNLNQDF